MLRSTGLAATLALLSLASPIAAQSGPGGPLDLRAQGEVPAAQPGADATVPGSSLVRTSVLRPAPLHLEAGALESGPPAASLMAPTRQNQAMMIVGGAGLIVGAIIGGDAGTIFMVGGGAIGLYGLWDYLR